MLSQQEGILIETLSTDTVRLSGRLSTHVEAVRGPKAPKHCSSALFNCRFQQFNGIISILLLTTLCTGSSGQCPSVTLGGIALDDDFSTSAIPCASGISMPLSTIINGIGNCKPDSLFIDYSGFIFPVYQGNNTCIKNAPVINSCCTTNWTNCFKNSEGTVYTITEGHLTPNSFLNGTIVDQSNRIYCNFIDPIFQQIPVTGRVTFGCNAFLLNLYNAWSLPTKTGVCDTCSSQSTVCSTPTTTVPTTTSTPTTSRATSTMVNATTRITGTTASTSISIQETTEDYNSTVNSTASSFNMKFAYASICSTILVMGTNYVTCPIKLTRLFF
jgi:hypothetical protein